MWSTPFHMWFVGSLLFKSAHENPADNWLWEEQFVLMECDSEFDAMEHALKLGKASEHDYDADGGRVLWKFDSVGDICALENLPSRHGTELFSRFLTESTVKSMREPFPD